MAFATLEAEGYGQFVGSIQGAFPHNMMDRSGMEVRAVPLFLHFLNVLPIFGAKFSKIPVISDDFETKIGRNPPF